MKFTVETWNEENKKLFKELCCDQDAFIINGCNGAYDEIKIGNTCIIFRNNKTLKNIMIYSDIQIDFNNKIITKYSITINECTHFVIQNLDDVKNIIKNLITC